MAIRWTDELGFVYRLSWTRTKANWRARVVKTFTTSCDLTTSHEWLWDIHLLYLYVPLNTY